MTCMFEFEQHRPGQQAQWGTKPSWTSWVLDKACMWIWRECRSGAGMKDGRKPPQLTANATHIRTRGTQPARLSCPQQTCRGSLNPGMEPQWGGFFTTERKNGRPSPQAWGAGTIQIPRTRFRGVWGTAWISEFSPRTPGASSLQATLVWISVPGARPVLALPTPPQTTLTLQS